VRVADQSGDAGAGEAGALIQQLQVGQLVFAAVRRRQVQCLVHGGQEVRDGAAVRCRRPWRGGVGHGWPPGAGRVAGPGTVARSPVPA